MAFYWINSKFNSLFLGKRSIFNYDNAIRIGITGIVLILILFRVNALSFEHHPYPGVFSLPSKIASLKSMEIMHQSCSNSLLAYFSKSSCHAQDKQGVWENLIQHFSINHQSENPAVKKEIKWIVNHPDYIKTLTKQSRPYLYHLYNEIKKRNLPGELALIPMIESEYDPFSSSNKGAAGIWQIMPHTARDLGLMRNWWVDARKNFQPATNAAFNYLSYLHQFFHGNWVLAVAAYNSGEGTVKRAIRRSHHNYFWTLRLPRETKRYIPKLLALSEIVQNPKRYHIQLPVLPNKPELEEIEVKNHLSLQSAAKLANIPKKQLYKLNPGFNNWSTPSAKPYKILMPSEYIHNFYDNLAKYSKTKLAILEASFKNGHSKIHTKKKKIRSHSHYKIHRRR